MKNAAPPFFLSVFWCELPRAVPFDLDNPPTVEQIEDGRRRADILSARYAFGKYGLLMLSVATSLYATVLASQRNIAPMLFVSVFSLGVFLIAFQYRRSEEPQLEDFKDVTQPEFIDLGAVASVNEQVGVYIDGVASQGRLLVAREIQLLDAALNNTDRQSGRPQQRKLYPARRAQG